MAPDHPEGRRRVVIEAVAPQIDGGRFPIKRVVGEQVVVETDLFADGHDLIRGVLRWRGEDGDWREVALEAIGNDRWRAAFPVSQVGWYRYTVDAWVDRLLTWRSELAKRLQPGAESDSELALQLRIGADLIDQAAARAPAADGKRLKAWARKLRGAGPVAARCEHALDDDLGNLAAQYPDRGLATRLGRELRVRVDRERARFSTWYEMFPRSVAEGRHGTFADCEARLDYVASMGFDVLYLPPIHPIGRTFRKGKNNGLIAGPDDVGSPWAIGGSEGGHTDIHPALGTVADFERLVRRARERGLEIALDIAFQVTPDHPWVAEHPEWFRHRPDGTIQYAENPPKKYQDIYPLDFETENWRGLWEELKGVVIRWAERGVRIFRVDNPHTKAFPFWEWLIAEVQAAFPDAIFLAEAFTRPKVMYRLAKAGFTQSYTYFAWRNTKAELTAYFTELTRTDVAQFFRPNLWPNTPDILTEYLQIGGRPAFMIRLVLAATLGASYGIYGPAFELLEHRALKPGSEEYLHSEKYQLREWNLNDPWSLKDFITRVNRIRRDNPALQRNSGLRFHPVDNAMVLCYSKVSESLDDAVVVVVNLDPRHRQAGWVTLDLAALGLEPGQTYQMHDELGDGRYLWQGPSNYVELDPASSAAHIFRIRREARTERDFAYYL
jgi:starch synthase (maltosyl-transferring)